MHLLTQDEIVTLYADMYSEATRIQKIVALMEQTEPSASLKEQIGRPFAMHVLEKIYEACDSNYESPNPLPVLEEQLRNELIFNILFKQGTSEQKKLDWIRNTFTSYAFVFTHGNKKQNCYVFNYCREQEANYRAHATSYDQIYELLCKHQHVLMMHQAHEELVVIEHMFNMLHDAKNTHQMRLTTLKEYLTSMERRPSDGETIRVLQEVYALLNRQHHANCFFSGAFVSLGLFASKSSGKGCCHNQEHGPEISQIY